jgi:hypothetical protein
MFMPEEEMQTHNTRTDFSTITIPKSIYHELFIKAKAYDEIITKKSNAGKISAARLTPEQLSERARKAVRTRIVKHGQQDKYAIQKRIALTPQIISVLTGQPEKREASVSIKKKVIGYLAETLGITPLQAEEVAASLKWSDIDLKNKTIKIKVAGCSKSAPKPL